MCKCPPWCSIVGATVTVHQFICILHFCHTCSLCRVELVVQFPARGSTQCYYAFFLVCCGCDISYIVYVHIQCQASIYTLLLCRGHSWRVRLAKQETLTLPGHLFSPLVCRGPWMSTVVLYCWCHSDSASDHFVFNSCRSEGAVNHTSIHGKLLISISHIGSISVPSSNMSTSVV